jgi:hypothetical protein
MEDTDRPSSRPRRVLIPRRQLAPVLARSVCQIAGSAPSEPAGGSHRSRGNQFPHLSVLTGRPGDLMLRAVGYARSDTDDYCRLVSVVRAFAFAQGYRLAEMHRDPASTAIWKDRVDVDRCYETLWRRGARLAIISSDAHLTEPLCFAAGIRVQIRAYGSRAASIDSRSGGNSSTPVQRRQSRRHTL